MGRIDLNSLTSAMAEAPACDGLGGGPNDLSAEVSVIIVNYNGKKYAEKCVESIAAADHGAPEIIVVDNGSSDGSVEYLKEKYEREGGRIRILCLPRNLGPAAARNRGAQIARGRYLGFLDNDTRVDPSWASEAVSCFEKDPKIGIVQCKLVLASDPRRIDYVGEYLGQYGFLVQEAEGGELDNGQHEAEKDILAAKSAGMFIRREVFEKVGGFDEDYFIYVEETDLGWRTWLAGYRARYVPGSIVYHEFGTSSIILGKIQNEYNAKYHGSKNYILTLLKNMGWQHALSTVPIHVIMWCGLATLLAWKGHWQSARYIVGGILWNAWNINKTLRKRRVIQRTRVQSDSEIFPVIRKRRPMKYYLNKAMSQRKVGNANGFVKPTDTSA